MWNIFKQNKNKKLILKYFENASKLLGYKFAKSKKGYRYTGYLSGSSHNFTLSFSSKEKEVGAYYVFKPIKAKNVVANHCDSWLRCSTKQHASFYPPNDCEYEINKPYTEDVNNLVFNYYGMPKADKFYKTLRQAHVDFNGEMFSLTVKQKDKLVGYGEVVFDEGYAFILNFAVNEDVKYADEIKSTILKLLVKEARANGCEYAYAICNREGKRALYKINGFEEIFQAYNCSILN